MSASTVKNLVEKSLREHIEAYFTSHPAIVAVSVREGQSVEERDIPCCICLCDSARPFQELPDVLGNYTCSVTLMVLSNVADSNEEADRKIAEEKHRERSTHIENAMQSDAAGLSGKFTANGLHLYSANFQGDSDGRESDSVMGNNLTYEVNVCCLPAT